VLLKEEKSRLDERRNQIGREGGKNSVKGGGGGGEGESKIGGSLFPEKGVSIPDSKRTVRGTRGKRKKGSLPFSREEEKEKRSKPTLLRTRIRDIGREREGRRGQPIASF